MSENSLQWILWQKKILHLFCLFTLPSDKKNLTDVKIWNTHVSPIILYNWRGAECLLRAKEFRSVSFRSVPLSPKKDCQRLCIMDGNLAHSPAALSGSARSDKPTRLIRTATGPGRAGPSDGPSQVRIWDLGSEYR